MLRGWRNPGWLAHPNAVKVLGKYFKYSAIHQIHNQGLIWDCKTFEGEECDGLIKPTAVFFGEGLPKTPWDSAVDKSKDTTLMIVIGSSLQVSPANSLPDVALKTGSELVIIDLMSTPFDTRAILKIEERAVLVSEMLEKCLDL